MLLELLEIKRGAVKQIGEDAAAIGQKLGIEPSWIVYEKKHIAPLIHKHNHTSKKRNRRAAGNADEAI